MVHQLINDQSYCEMASPLTPNCYVFIFIVIVVVIEYCLYWKTINTVSNKQGQRKYMT